MEFQLLLLQLCLSLRCRLQLHALSGLFESLLNPKLIENTFELFKIKHYLKGETVLKSGYKLSSKIIIVIEGNIINEKVNKTICKRYDIAFEDELTNESEDKLNFDLKFINTQKSIFGKDSTQDKE